MINFTFHTEDEELGFSDRVPSHDIQKIAQELKRVKPSKIAVQASKTTVEELRKTFKNVAESLRSMLLPSNVREPSFKSFKPNSYLPDLEGISIETWKRAKTHTIKFQQKYQDIPVYGTQVTLEVDENDELLAIDSTIAEFIEVSPSPNYKPEQLKDLIEESTKRDLTNYKLKPALHYYYDSTPEQKRWRLVYFVETQLESTVSPITFESIQQMVDYVIDAHTGDIVLKLPRVKTVR